MSKEDSQHRPQDPSTWKSKLCALRFQSFDQWDLIPAVETEPFGFLYGPTDRHEARRLLVAFRETVFFYNLAIAQPREAGVHRRVVVVVAEIGDRAFNAERVIAVPCLEVGWDERSAGGKRLIVIRQAEKSIARLAWGVSLVIDDTGAIHAGRRDARVHVQGPKRVAHQQRVGWNEDRRFRQIDVLCPITGRLGSNDVETKGFNIAATAHRGGIGR